MTARQIAVAVLLSGAGLTAVLSVAGVALMQGAYNKMHFVAPLAAIGSAAVAAAVVTRELLDARGIKALLVFGMLAGVNAVVVHAIARAGRLREPRSRR